MKPSKTVVVEWLEPDDPEKQRERLAELLSEGVYAYLRELGLLEVQLKQQQVKEKSPVDKK